MIGEPMALDIQTADPARGAQAVPARVAAPVTEPAAPGNGVPLRSRIGFWGSETRHPQPAAERPDRTESAPAEPLLRELLGRELREVRHRRGLTLRELATSSRVSRAYLSEVERGRKEVSSELLIALCRALQVELSDLLDRMVGGLRRDQAGAVIPLRQAVLPLAGTGPRRSGGARGVSLSVA